ncbi:sugar phosphate nucleotidyltransferase [Xylanimonas allomyrinae]|uniref:sugar phosphate nucleotidyltransferase n=1 Tax=Xylanimonas allomyrinae TaxID=2509459 RepID=UPI0013A673FF|nr:sugar phosphate nucleotidyltransferase [Xylanimonas allomyrinae]
MRYGFILAGGLGTRLRPYTFVLPKPLIPLGNETIIERVLRSFRQAELRNVAVSLGYLGHLLEAVVGNGAKYELNVEYTHEDEPLGTAGALGLLPFNVADDDVVLVMNGDTLTSLDLNEFLTWFEQSHADAAMACVQREVRIDYGVVTTDVNGNLEAIAEKPSSVNLLSTGINVFRGSALRELPAGRVDMPNFLVQLAMSGKTIACKTIDDLWMDLGRVEDLTAANELVDRGVL